MIRIKGNPDWRKNNMHNLQHGKSHSRTYNSWKSMKARCSNPKLKEYIMYGGSGISYCASWEKFAGFFADMGERPAGKTLDRIDNKLGYSVGNCRWATNSEQKLNRRPFKRRTREELGIERPNKDSVDLQTHIRILRDPCEREIASCGLARLPE